MRHGPWESYAVLYQSIHEDFPKLRSVTGKQPVAIERRGDEARVLFELPDDFREPIPINIGLPEYWSED